MSKYRINVAGKVYEMEIEKVEGAISEMAGKDNRQGMDSAVSQNTTEEGNLVCSPMPGTVIKIYVKNGDAVKSGQTILLLEAMKMENEITAPRDGIVSGLNVMEKQTVQGGTPLFEIVECED